MTETLCPVLPHKGSSWKPEFLPNSWYHWTFVFCLKSAPSSLLLLSLIHFPAACWLLSHSLLHRIYRLPASPPLLFLFFFFKHLTITADTSFLNSFGSPITAVFQELQLSSDSHHLLVPQFSLSIAHLLFSFPCFLKELYMLFFLYDISVPDLCSVPRCERLNAGSVLALISS